MVNTLAKKLFNVSALSIAVLAIDPSGLVSDEICSLDLSLDLA